MEPETFRRRQNRGHEKEKEQTHRRKERDPRSERPGIELLGKIEPDRGARHERLELPAALPFARAALLRRRRNRARQKIDLVKIGGQAQTKILDAPGPRSEIVLPARGSARLVL